MIPFALAYPLALLPFATLLGALTWMARTPVGHERASGWSDDARSLV
jgi:hypothetical protein